MNHELIQLAAETILLTAFVIACAITFININKIRKRVCGVHIKDKDADFWRPILNKCSDSELSMIADGYKKYVRDGNHELYVIEKAVYLAVMIRQERADLELARFDEQLLRGSQARERRVFKSNDPMFWTQMFDKFSEKELNDVTCGFMTHMRMDDGRLAEINNVAIKVAYEMLTEKNDTPENKDAFIEQKNVTE